MKINLDDLVAAITPDPVVIEIGGGTFTVNDLTVGDVLRLSKISMLADEKQAADALAFVKSLFKGDTPRQFDELFASLAEGDGVSFGERQFKMQKVSLILSTINIALNEVAGIKKLMAATETIRNRLTTSSESLHA